MLPLPILVQIVQLDSTWSVFNILPSPFFHYLHVIVFIILGWIHIGGACTGRSSCFLVFSLVANGLDWALDCICSGADKLELGSECHGGWEYRTDH